MASIEKLMRSSNPESPKRPRKATGFGASRPGWGGCLLQFRREVDGGRGRNRPRRGGALCRRRRPAAGGSAVRDAGAGPGPSALRVLSEPLPPRGSGEEGRLRADQRRSRGRQSSGGGLGRGGVAGRRHLHGRAGPRGNPRPLSPGRHPAVRADGARRNLRDGRREFRRVAHDGLGLPRARSRPRDRRRSRRCWPRSRQTTVTAARSSTRSRPTSGSAGRREAATSGWRRSSSRAGSTS